MGCHNNCVLLHFYLACLVVDGGTCPHINIQRFWHNERGGVAACLVRLRPCICFWAHVSRSYVRGVRPRTGPSAGQLGVSGLQPCMWCLYEQGSNDRIPISGRSWRFCAIGGMSACDRDRGFFYKLADSLQLGGGVLSDCWRAEGNSNPNKKLVPERARQIQLGRI